MSKRLGNAEAPIVSVLLAVPGAWPGDARRLARSIDSILSQTLSDIELIIIDGGGDIVPETLRRYTDPRLTHLPTATVTAWEEGFGESTGRYIALLEPGDVALPARLARQSASLESSPGTVLLGTATRPLLGGLPQPSQDPPESSPTMLGWLLMLGLPPSPGSLMFPAQAARDLRGGLGGAGDGGLDLCLRLSDLGRIVLLGERLTLVASVPPAPERIAEVLALPYESFFGDQAAAWAGCVAHHVSSRRPVNDLATLQALARIFAALTQAATAHAVAVEAAAIREHASRLWRDVLARTLHGRDLPRSAVQAVWPVGIERIAARPTPASPRASPPAPAPAALPGKLFQNVYDPCPADPSAPPTLFVVVDTEAEFDWGKPFTRDLTSVCAMDDIERGQAVFDSYGLRPIYVVDYPVASQPRGFSTLRAIMQRDGCEIGAHLHPWTTPPFEETLSARNSYPGNLDPSLEERKLAVLMAVIRENFGISPVFYKAGRYGFGPATPLALEKHGIRIDLSVLPGADLRRQGGPDFRALKPVFYRIAGTGVMSLPMTRSEVGLLPGLARLGRLAQSLPGGRYLHVPSVLARLRITDTITLTPEGVTGDEQLRLIRAMLKRGHRQFVLHYHSPSLSPGHTPYATDQSGARTVIARLEHVCRFFFDEIGGIPGYPRDLLLMAEDCLG